MIRIAVIGGRDFNDFELLSSRLGTLLNRYYLEPVTIVSGKAPGADTLAYQYAQLNGIEIKEYPADWANIEIEPCKIKVNRYGTQYNVLAGFNRNTTIVENSDIVLAFWDGKSPGTKDSITKAKALDKDVIIIEY